MSMKLALAAPRSASTTGSVAKALAKAGLAVPLLIVKQDSLGEAALELSGNDGRGGSGGGADEEEEDGFGSSALSFRPIKAAVEVRMAGSMIYRPPVQPPYDVPLSPPYISVGIVQRDATRVLVAEAADPDTRPCAVRETARDGAQHWHRERPDAAPVRCVHG